MHTINCPDCVNGWQERNANHSSGIVRCIECDGTGEIEVEVEVIQPPMHQRGWSHKFVGEQK